MHQCEACGRERGAGIACQFCDQVDGLPVGIRLSSPARRFGGYLLEGLLVVVTLGVGWFVWSLVVYGRGQTPAKQVLRMRIVSLQSGRPANWGRTLLREWIAKPVAGILSWLTLGIAYFWLLWDGKNQELWDKMVGTIVVTDRHGQLVARAKIAEGPPPLVDVQNVKNWT
jgi:uncharacterized RDD family membrane protein YckC